MFDVKKLFEEKIGKEKMQEYLMPAPSFSIMECEIIFYDEKSASLTLKVPLLEKWMNPYKTMQGGVIMMAIDNAVGSLSMLVAPKNITRNMESKMLKPITMDVENIYIKVKLQEQKKRRLIFDVEVLDEHEVCYTTATITNWMI